MENRKSVTGLFCAVSAYLTWGFSPIFFKAMASVPAFEILMHRMVWSFLFLLLMVILFKRRRRLTEALTSRHNLKLLSLSTLLVSGNWFLFIWAINSNHILQTSLGYYINPLVNVLLGTVFLKERLRKLQMVAVVLAGLGVGYLTVHHGEFPWIALTLAVSFGLYGFIRKTAPVEALEGLTVETLILSIPAALYLLYLHHTGAGSLFHDGFQMDLLLMGTALVTAFPLLLFTIGARRLRFVTMGFLQYIAPSCTFVLAVFVYQEPFGRAQVYTFIMIWLALTLFSIDAVRAWHHSSGFKSSSSQAVIK
ncbi:MAG: EamA family transporter RarD [Desulfobacteraceae bacterium]|nr:MAG: EamA family transporter RarD [Desulfobacteraceae bacterium]